MSIINEMVKAEIEVEAKRLQRYRDLLQKPKDDPVAMRKILDDLGVKVSQYAVDYDVVSEHKEVDKIASGLEEATKAAQQAAMEVGNVRAAMKEKALLLHHESRDAVAAAYRASHGADERLMLASDAAKRRKELEQLHPLILPTSESEVPVPVLPSRLTVRSTPRN